MGDKPWFWDVTRRLTAMFIVYGLLFSSVMNCFAADTAKEITDTAKDFGSWTPAQIWALVALVEGIALCGIVVGIFHALLRGPMAKLGSLMATLDVTIQSKLESDAVMLRESKANIDFCREHSGRGHAERAAGHFRPIAETPP